MSYLTKFWYWLRGQYYVLINPEHKIKTFYAFACGIAYQHEPDYEIYDSVERLKEAHPYWEECGIVELKIVEHKWVANQHLFKNSLEEQNEA